MLIDDVNISNRWWFLGIGLLLIAQLQIDTRDSLNSFQSENRMETESKKNQYDFLIKQLSEFTEYHRSNSINVNNVI